MQDLIDKDEDDSNDYETKPYNTEQNERSYEKQSFEFGTFSKLREENGGSDNEDLKDI